MWEIIERFLILVQFMTRIPVFVKIEFSDEKLGKSIKYFPILGLIIGIILFTASLILTKIIGNDTICRLIIALLIIILEIFVVGIIHLDGLADTFDALFSYASREKMLEIMKDSRIGTNGAIILILYFFSKILLIAQIISINTKFLILYPILARLSTPINAGFSNYARKNGMSNAIIEQNSKKEAFFSIILVIVLSVFVLKLKGLISTIIAIIFILFFLMNIKKKIKGITGDTMGASLELTSLVVLMVGVILK